MRAPRTLSAYLVREVFQYTALGLAAITIVLVTRNLLRYLDDLIAAGLSPGDLFTVLRLLGLMLAVYSVPLAFLFGVLLAVGRMSSDVEITAMRACGISLAQITLPIALAGALISAGTWYLVFEVEHAADRELRSLVKGIAARSAAIEPGRFKHIGERVFFVREREESGRLLGVVISDRSDAERPLMIFAESGRVTLDEERGELSFQLEKGDIHIEPVDGAEGRYHRLSFLQFDYVFDIGALLGTQFSQLRPRQMSMGELREIVAQARAGGSLEHLRKQDPVQYELQIHRRLASPVAPALFALVGVPLGMRRTRGARSWGVLLCALVGFIYYVILVFSQYLATEHWLPAAIALWIPNVVFAALAAGLLWRARRFES